MQKKDLPKALVGHSLLLMGGVVILPAFIYLVMFLLEPFVVFGFGSYLIWSCIRRENGS